ncbi:glycosyltransferase [Kibdelosporangium persicum]|uniref:Glycosyltransferase involved in cell wall biosynthesis n=1 Tax=Kibdelosporangium persicum TaxID=2698649 RepID=A0ABX2EYZ0_9PSEU|nr:glycosyltransferase [Kibdelosporangium persicum]NRN64203.1 Glycosyltransferase involved in cell wall biosynthesis [Kibdelosporangium persicum]
MTLLSIVVPVRNEESRLPGTLRGLTEALAGITRSAEIVVVDNASTDRSVDIVRAHQLGAIPIRLVHCAQLGKGAAVRAGVLQSDSPYVGFCDADLATDMAALEPTLTQLGAGVNVVVGSRAHPSSIVKARHSLVRQAGAWVFRQVANGFVPGVGDTQCGYKFFDRRTADAVFRPLRTFGFAFDVELLARAQRIGAVIFELPVCWRDVPGSTFHPVRDGYRSFSALARMRSVLAEPDHPAAVPEARPVTTPIAEVA